MNLLVTGGAGFIGSHLVLLLLERPEVERLVNLDCLTYAGKLANVAEAERSPKYRFVRADMRDLAAVRQTMREHAITHAVHLAAESHVDRSIAAPADFITSNVIGTFNLLEAARERDGSFQRLVHVSTDEVYGSLGAEGAFTEESPLAPNSPYSASKASSDLLVRAYHHTYGLDAIITRCSNNFGPRQHREKLIPAAVRALARRLPVPVYGDGMNARDWLHVADHAEALWQVLLKGRSGKVYNIGARNEWANLRLVEAICDLVDELEPALGGHSRRLIEFVKDRPGHDRRYAIDPSKIERETGWRAVTPFGQALRDTVRWHLGQAQLETKAGW